MFDENAIVNRVLNKDLRAFELLVKQYEQLVFFVIHRLVQDKQNKEDICQEVFIKIHQSLPSFRFQSKLSTWIARITYLTAVNYVKSTKNRLSHEYPENIDNYHFTDENPERELIKKNTSAYVNHLISQMPHHYKTVLTLYHLNEFSLAEIKDITGIPEGTAKSYLFRARKLLKEKIEKDLKRENT
ncbi:RNA polymerase subunit sigma-24 [Pedobacter antarcticus 4BY]|uniref:RNA polymerase subunit sigma-24 n=2 Tax=Pedobacter antarcticus TaxID=34086 RepID=A0A081PBZ9_9SPHI|nr:sigma-70 family RNA polymerase sigma factor [Pedobacter antarcticus]KEQ28222.1 RNA polymerase subunit sigma-24 [Pedobacter antarcticus 4BY]SFE45761.1 RNA polymerase sigma-70 factor, ECF subfamily [Pedobacter antarcticus]